MALAQGEYVQFLDADDFLLPEKIAEQVASLERTGATAAYGDWRHQFHEPDGAVWLGPVQVMGPREDLLESLLLRRWIPTVTLCLRKRVVERLGGWDESLAAAQDIDLVFALVLGGEPFVYRSGCHAIYRRYGAVTVSTTNRQRWLEATTRVAVKVEKGLAAVDWQTPRHRRALAGLFFYLAREFLRFSRTRYHDCVARTLAVDPGYRFHGSPGYRRLQSVLGFRTTERLASWWRACAKR
jgi:GT2 family glycosyltransferase